ncbi:glycosyl hydrolase family 47-domain-containing protein [Diplogelasinospora grovesii]|uniref:alpha-1,2-Mannosidase n=1 Tax=Diplogelasinospora grovesii TaxID=303347 RepID=A0AAN6S9H2_9PEZI|nr:glycosyl hydrolase family 47-domain-containing protein [Diplogelasinospora grovesii]
MAILKAPRRLPRLLVFVAVTCIIFTYFLLDRIPQRHGKWRTRTLYVPSSFDWAKRRQTHPLFESDMTRLPEGPPHELPRIQHDFSLDTPSKAHNQTQRRRRDAVRSTAQKCWATYREYAWGYDELRPQTLSGLDTFSGWGATLVDSLDTLWIMGLRTEFQEAVRMVGTIDWDNSTGVVCSLFETNIRYLGGLLSAYDLSQEKTLIKKAVELGNMLYAAFDTPNHMPANAFHFERARRGLLVADSREQSASVGTLSLEFTRLSQITGDMKFYSVIDRIKSELERTQSGTKLPGMWPTFVDLRNGFLTPDSSFTLGAMADSAYEYLSKMYVLLGGLDPTYKKMHTKAMETVRNHLLFRPMLPDADTADILFPGTVLSNGGKIIDLLPEVQHLGCFTGGMFALGGKLFGIDEHVEIGEKLARGCAWAYEAFPTGVMPEVSEIMPCKTPNLKPCEWNETRWQEESEDAERFSKGIRAVRAPGYMLRPEAIESIFILYRITGKEDLLDVAWRMFESIQRATETKFANSAIADVQADGGYTTKIDSMESFWIAETLKYFYLIFSDPELISLDEYVFNTEAHPFKRPKPGGDDMPGGGEKPMHD